MRQPRFEIVRSDAEQPWHARFRAANGRVVFSTEQYARRDGAERAIHAAARAFWQFASFGFDEIGVLFIGDGAEQYVVVRTVDERTSHA